jgi:uncharacterized protein (DUF1778 family)
MENMEVDLNAEEKEQLEKAAQAQGLTLEEFISQAVSSSLQQKTHLLQQRLQRPVIKPKPSWH